MPRSYLVIALCTLLTATLAHAEPVALDRIVAVVNDDVVLHSELQVALRSDPNTRDQLSALGSDASKEAMDTKLRQLQGGVLDLLVGDKLVLGEAARYQLSVNEDEVDMYLRNLAQQNGMQTVAELKNAVAASGEFGRWADYRAMHQKQILLYRTEQVVLQVNVSDAQIREYYRKMSKGEDARVEVVRMSFRPKNDDAPARDAAYAFAKQAARRLAAGEDVASIEADGVTAVAETVARGQIAPTMEDQLFAARKGQVVGPLQAGQGFEVFKVVAHLASDVVPFEEAKEKIRSQLYEEAFVKARTQWREDLRARAHIDIRL
ncbi:MAG: peptidylprolyl isomerase [Nannocystaceae bacterium]